MHGLGYCLWEAGEGETKGDQHETAQPAAGLGQRLRCTDILRLLKRPGLDQQSPREDTAEIGHYQSKLISFETLRRLEHSHS